MSEPLTLEDLKYESLSAVVVRDAGISHALAVSHNGKLIGSYNYHYVVVYDANNGDVIWRWSVVSDEGIYAKNIEFSRDNTKILAACGQTLIKIWDLESGQLVHVISRVFKTSWRAFFSFDGTKVLSHGHNLRLTCYENELPYEPLIICDLENHKSDVKYFLEESVAKDEQEDGTLVVAVLSPDGQMLATGHLNGQIRLYECETRKLVAKWKPSENSITDLVWSQDGTMIAFCSFDETSSHIKIVELEGKTLLKTLKTKSKFDFIDSPTFLPGGQLFSYFIYETSPNVVIAEIFGDRKFVVSNRAFSPICSPDGKWLYFGKHGDNVETIRRFDLACCNREFEKAQRKQKKD